MAYYILTMIYTKFQLLSSAEYCDLTVLSDGLIQANRNTSSGRKSYQKELSFHSNGGFSYRKEFAPLRSKFFPLTEAFILEGFHHSVKQTESHKIYFHCNNVGKRDVYAVTLNLVNYL